MSEWIRNEGYKWVVTIIAIILAASFFIVQPQLQTVDSNITKWGTIVASWMLLIGVGSLTMRHLNQIRKRSPGQWYYSAWLVFLLYFMCALGYVSDYLNPGLKPTYDLFYTKVYAVLSSSTYGICSFYLVSMAFRAFRARSLEATAFIIAGLVVTFYQMPAGVAIWGPIVPLGEWILDFPVLAGQRAWIMAIGIGTIAAAFRRILQIKE